MKNNSLCSIAALFFLLVCSGLPGFAEPVIIGGDQAVKLIKSGAVLVDVRTFEEFDQGNIDGSILLPYEQILELPDVVEVAKDTPIVLYCRSGKRAGIAKDALDKAGYTRVYNAGGYDDLRQHWEQAYSKSERQGCCDCCTCCKK